MLDEEIQYRLLKMVEESPAISQRELAKRLGVSLGKTNYCLKALVERGWIKIGNFRSNPDKRAYTYLLTPSGIQGKLRVTAKFLKRKMREYELIEREIEQLKKDLPNDQDKGARKE